MSASHDEADAVNAFDGDPATYWDSGSRDDDYVYLVYGAEEPFLLTDYQLVWYSEDAECPVSWYLYGFNDGTEMEPVHVVQTGRLEPDTHKYLNFTVPDPGYYQYYMWYFTEYVEVGYKSYRVN